MLVFPQKWGLHSHPNWGFFLWGCTHEILLVSWLVTITHCVRGILKQRNTYSGIVKSARHVGIWVVTGISRKNHCYIEMKVFTRIIWYLCIWYFILYSGKFGFWGCYDWNRKSKIERRSRNQEKKRKIRGEKCADSFPFLTNTAITWYIRKRNEISGS